MHLGGDLGAHADRVAVELHRCGFSHRITILCPVMRLSARSVRRVRPITRTMIASQPMNRLGARTTTSSRPSSIWASGAAGCRPGGSRRCRRRRSAPGTLELAVVDADLHPHRREPQRLDAGDEVGEPADLLLQVVVDAGHDLGVHAEPGHDQEAGLGRSFGAGSVGDLLGELFGRGGLSRCGRRGQHRLRLRLVDARQRMWRPS